jgi:tRNA acetyltransferase TAN1
MEGKRSGSAISKKDPKKRKQYISGRGRGQVTAAKYKIDAAQIHSGLRGIFISTNHLKEDLAARETLAMLLEVAPDVYPQFFDASASGSDADNDGEPSVLDIEAELKKERDSLKERRDHFSLVTLPHAKNKAFVRILDDTIDPSLLLDKFFDSIVENGSSPTKHCLRFTPVLRTCLASNQEQWVKVLADALSPYFKVDPDQPPKS